MNHLIRLGVIPAAVLIDTYEQAEEQPRMRDAYSFNDDGHVSRNRFPRDHFLETSGAFLWFNDESAGEIKGLF
jgi:hypothetical protein